MDHRKLNKKTKLSPGFQIGAPTGIRTPVVALKGPRPSPLDDRGSGTLFCTADQCQPYGLWRREAAHAKAGGLYHRLWSGSSNWAAYFSGFTRWLISAIRSTLRRLINMPALSTLRLGIRMPESVALKTGMNSRVPSVIRAVKSKRP